MNSTNPKSLRANMKSYLDCAAKKPLRILRRSGESYILINEKNYSEMQDEIRSLQRRLLSLAHHREGYSDHK